MRGKRFIAGGRGTLRKVLYQAAMVASQHNTPLKAFAKRLKEAGKPHKVVITAIARKIVIILNAMCKKNEKWKEMRV